MHATNSHDAFAAGPVVVRAAEVHAVCATQLWSDRQQHGSGCKRDWSDKSRKIHLLLVLLRDVALELNLQPPDPSAMEPLSH